MASFGALTMVILQFVLGAAYSLWGTAPTSTQSVGMFSSPLLAIHVVVGILLVIAAAFLVFRAAQAKSGAVLVFREAAQRRQLLVIQCCNNQQQCVCTGCG